MTLRKQIRAIDIRKYTPISEFLKIIDDFSFIPDNELETLEIGIFDRKRIRAIRLDNQLCLTLKQTANYIDVVKKTLESVWDRHKKDLEVDLDYLQIEGIYYLTLRGVEGLVSVQSIWTQKGSRNTNLYTKEGTRQILLSVDKIMHEEKKENKKI